MADEPAVVHVLQAQSLVRSPDLEIAELARMQHGVVARRQLVALGLTRGEIAWRLDCGRLHPVYRGVYAVGHRAISRQGTWMAAVLAGGPDAVLSHRPAAALFGVLATRATRIDVTVPRSGRSRPGIELHESRIPPDERTIVDGIPVTTVARTLLDLAAMVSEEQLARALHEAEVLRLWEPLSLRDLIARHPRRRGIPRARAVLARQEIGAGMARNALEERFARFVDAWRLPPPEVNAPVEVGGRHFEADFLWRSARVIVELDGYATHATRRSYERDRERDRILQAAGWRVVRITWRQLLETPGAVAEDLRRLLAQPSGHPSPGHYSLQP